MGIFDRIDKQFKTPKPLQLECFMCQSTNDVIKYPKYYVPEDKRPGDEVTEVPLCATCRKKQYTAYWGAGGPCAV